MQLEWTSDGLLQQADAVVELRVCCDKSMRILLLYHVYLAKRSGKLGALRYSKLHIVCEYNATVELVSTCHRMRMWMWTWMWARAATPPVCRPSSPVRFLIMKLGTNYRFCSAHFDWYFFGSARVHFTQLLERGRRPTALDKMLLGNCLPETKSQRESNISRRRMRFILSVWYNTIFSVWNWINKGNALG